MPNRHELKTWPAEFSAVRTGVKTFEHRKNDRNFQVNDVLVLREFDPEKFFRAFDAAMPWNHPANDYAGILALRDEHVLAATAAEGVKTALARKIRDDLKTIRTAIAAAEKGAYSGKVEEREVAYVLQGGEFGVMPGYAVLGLRPPAATAAQLVENMTAEDLAAWHFAQGQNARLRAENSRGVAKGYAAEPETASSAQRWVMMAEAAERDAALHLSAAELIRRLANGEPTTSPGVGDHAVERART